MLSRTTGLIRNIGVMHITFKNMNIGPVDAHCKCRVLLLLWVLLPFCTNGRECSSLATIHYGTHSGSIAEWPCFCSSLAGPNMKCGWAMDAHYHRQAASCEMLLLLSQCPVHALADSMGRSMRATFDSTEHCHSSKHFTCVLP